MRSCSGQTDVIISKVVSMDSQWLITPYTNQYMTIGHLDLPVIRNIQWPGKYLVNSLLSKSYNTVS